MHKNPTHAENTISVGNMFFKLLSFLLLLHSLHALNVITRYESNEIGKKCGRTPVYKDQGYKVLNGNLAKNGQFPWAVNIHYYGGEQHGFTCGGTLITRRHVLTAGHCVVKDVCLGRVKSPRDYKVFIGSIIRGRGHQFGVRDIKVNKRWGAGAIQESNCLETGGDIAVIELDRDVTDDMMASGLVALGCLASPSEQYGSDIVAHGWGYTFGTNPETNLVWTSLKKMPYDKCRKNWRQNSKFRTRIPNDVICTRELTTNVCGGDSGGPLLQQKGGRYHMVGLVSSGAKCEKMRPGKEDNGGAYTDVRKYLYWLCYETGACYSL